MISCVDDFALTAPSLSYQGHIRRLQELFERLEAKALHSAQASPSLLLKESSYTGGPQARGTPRSASPPSRSKGSCSAPGTQNDS